MQKSEQLLVFSVHEQRYALHLANVERIVRAVEVTPLPESPESVLGVVNVQGRIIPVLSLRKRLKLTEREIELNDRLIIAECSERSVAMLVDSVLGVVEASEDDLVPAHRIAPGMEFSDAMLKIDDTMVLIPNLDKLSETV